MRGNMQQTFPLARPQSLKLEISSRFPNRLQIQWLSLPLGLFLFLAGWQGFVVYFGYEAFILPSPTVVAQRFGLLAESGLLWPHVFTTLQEALGGFGVALVVSLVLGYILAHLPWLERALAPILAGGQAVPILAVAPLIMLWFGTEISAKILVAALVTFFPMLISTIIALRTIPRELREMAAISGANQWQILFQVEFPLALPVLLGGVRTSLSLATTGAVVGEFVAGREGLGALINIARGLFDTPLIFVALIMLAAITLLLYLCSCLLEKLLIRWEW